MSDQPFECKGCIGKVKRKNAVLQAFDGALYTKKLYKVYPDVAEDLRTALSMSVQSGSDDVTLMPGSELIRPDIQASLVISGQIGTFCSDIAPRITDLDSDDVRWVKAQAATPEQVDAMFQFWLEHEDFREEVTRVIEALDFPNGKEGASAALLTTEEQQDPLSEKPELSTETV